MSFDRSNIKSWRRDNFLVSTDPALLDIAAVQKAMKSDMIYWYKDMPDHLLKATLENSLTFGLYIDASASTKKVAVEGEKAEEKGTDSPAIAAALAAVAATEEGKTKELEKTKRGLEQIGLARYITDGVTFAYLTDVYVLSEHQSSGLGSWLMRCTSELLDEWPYLRRTALLTSGQKNIDWYAKVLGTFEMPQGKSELKFLSKPGKGASPVLLKMSQGH